MTSLKFGTSGLRGLVSDLEGWPSFAYALAFLRHVTDGGERRVFLGRDLRSSSPAILDHCIAAAHAAGFTPVDVGAVPTPALALAALEARCPAIMVTGSHIPDDRNGLKFYRRDGEIAKADEAGILAAFAAIEAERTAPDAANGTKATIHDAAGPFKARYTSFFATDALAGLRIGVFQHSSVARDILVDLVRAAGGEAVPLGRSDRFIPVDTEAHRPEDVAQIRDWARTQRLDAIVSTDGDGDRPLVADADGTIVRGEIVGLLTARYLGLRTIVTPVTSSSAMETASGGRVLRTKVGSPFVIAGMGEALAEGATDVLGFEANGGLLLGSVAIRDGRTLPALMTRDSVLPILSALALVRQSGQPLSRLVADATTGHAAAHRLPDIAASASGPFLQRLAADDTYRTDFFAPVGTVRSFDTIDGVRCVLDKGAVIHFRASGNAPELRCYVEASSGDEARTLLAWGLERAGKAVQ